MKLSEWGKIIFAGPLLALRIGELAASSCFVIARRSRRLISAVGNPDSRDRREAALMVREKVEGGVESAAATLQFVAAALNNEVRRYWSLLNYLKSALRSLYSSRSPVDFIVTALTITAKLDFLIIKQIVRMAIFTTDVVKNAIAPLQRRVISNATRLSKPGQL